MKRLIEISFEKWGQLNSLGLDTVFDYKNRTLSGDAARFIDPDEIVKGLLEGDYSRLTCVDHYTHMKETFPGTQFKFYAMVEAEH